MQDKREMIQNWLKNVNKHYKVEDSEKKKVIKRKSSSSRNNKSKIYIYWKEFEAQYGNCENFHHKIKAVKTEDEWEKDEYDVIEHNFKRTKNCA